MSPKHGKHFRLGKIEFHHTIVVISLVAIAATQNASALESQSYVIGWFSQAVDASDDDCPDGIHPEIEFQYLENLKPLGFSPAKISEYRRKLLAGEKSDLGEIMASRGRVNGQPVNPYANPATVADPGLAPLKSEYAYGFNLDGKGADAPNAFVDPATGETGVDNEMYRALGCARSFHGTLSGRTSYWDWVWGQTKASQPAWLVTLSAEDLSTDGDAQIEFYRAVEYLRSNSDGSPRSYETYRIDPDPRSHNKFKAVIENGVAYVTEHKEMRLLQNPLSAPEFALSKTHLRLHLDNDDPLRGFIGGYQSWELAYFGFATTGSGGETTIIGDIPGIYYLLRNHADADPDPASGINRAISTTYYFEAVPAFVKMPQLAEVGVVSNELRRTADTNESN